MFILKNEANEGLGNYKNGSKVSKGIKKGADVMVCHGKQL